jgi:hypothetical protein
MSLSEKTDDVKFQMQSTGEVAQVVKHLPSKYKIPSSNPSNTTKKKNSSIEVSHRFLNR